MQSIYHKEPLQAALSIAKKLSTEANCARAQVGCVITDKNGKMLSGGFNAGYCAGKDLCPAYDNSVSCNTIHAEEAALNNVPEGRLDDIYFAIVTKRPCDNCNKILLNAGVKFIIYSGDSNE